MKAFDLIKNLPDGEIDISATDKNVVMIKIEQLQQNTRVSSEELPLIVTDGMEG